MARARRHCVRAITGGAVLVTALLAPAALLAQATVIEPGDFNARLDRLERVVNAGTLVELLDRVDRLQREVRELRGQIEVQNYELGQLKQNQRQHYLDLDTRLQRLEGGAPPLAEAPEAGVTPEPAPVAAAPAVPEPAVAPAATPGVSSADPLAEQAAYQAAFDQLKAGRYEEASQALTRFIADYPNGQYADNAQYWLGESYYVTRQFPKALEQFQAMVQRFPGSQKLTHALLKVGFIHDELGQRDDAVRVLNDLVTRYPGSTAAGLAKKRLDRLRGQ